MVKLPFILSYWLFFIRTSIFLGFKWRKFKCSGLVQMFETYFSLPIQYIIKEINTYYIKILCIFGVAVKSYSIIMYYKLYSFMSLTNKTDLYLWTCTLVCVPYYLCCWIFHILNFKPVSWYFYLCHLLLILFQFCKYISM